MLPPAAPKVQFQRAIVLLEWVERAVFVVIGILLFIAALVLLFRSTGFLVDMALPDNRTPLTSGTQFLDRILLVLMMVELAYTVVLSIKGQVLLAEPFLIVGLIAVIRRILVITVSEVNHGMAPSSPEVLNELEVLAGITAVLVISIAVLRWRPFRGLAPGTTGADHLRD
jgi:hypothetical protein